MGDAAVFKPEEEHDGAASYSNDANPVDGLEASEDRGLRGFDVEEDEDDDEGEGVKGEVDVETPTPGDFFGKYTAEDGTESAGETPDTPDHAKVLSSVSVFQLE